MKNVGVDNGREIQRHDEQKQTDNEELCYRCSRMSGSPVRTVFTHPKPSAADWLLTWPRHSEQIADGNRYAGLHANVALLQSSRLETSDMTNDCNAVTDEHYKMSDNTCSMTIYRPLP